MKRTEVKSRNQCRLQSLGLLIACLYQVKFYTKPPHRSSCSSCSLLNALIYSNSTEVETKRRRGTTPQGYKLGAGKKAHVSPRPGETVELGFYSLRDEKTLTLVDCPGYGFNVRSDER